MLSKSKIVILIALLLSLSAAQTKILVCDFERRGVTDTMLVRITSQLLQDALNATYKFTVLVPVAGSQVFTVMPAAESARAYGAAQALIGNLMQVGSKSYLSYQVIDASSATVRLADRVEIPPFDELPRLTERIAQSIQELAPFGRTAQPEKMTSTEVEPKFKFPRQPCSSIFLTAGYHFQLKPRTFQAGPDTGKTTYTMGTNLVNLNIATSFETQQLLTMLQLGLMRSVHDERDLNFDLFINRVFGNGDWAPMVGGGIGITRYTWQDPYISSHRMRDDGLSLSAGGGVLGLRTYYFRLLAAAYGNYTLTSTYGWKGVPGVRVAFGVTAPTMGPDATVKLSPGLVGGIIGGFFLTGLIIALSS